MIWNSEVPTTTLVGMQQVDQRRHHDEAAADAHDRRQEADAGAEREHRDDADEQLRGLEPHLQRQPVDPVVLAGFFARAAPLRVARRIAFTLSTSISPPTVPSSTT